jgi:thioredoxin 1
MVKLLDFWATWCGPCKFMEPIIEDLEKELAGKVEIEKIDVDKNQEMASKYGVMSIPTYVVIKDDKEVERIIGATSKDNLKKALGQ